MIKTNWTSKSIKMKNSNKPQTLPSTKLRTRNATLSGLNQYVPYNIPIACFAVTWDQSKSQAHECKYCLLKSHHILYLIACSCSNC